MRAKNSLDARMCRSPRYSAALYRPRTNSPLYPRTVVPELTVHGEAFVKIDKEYIPFHHEKKRGGLAQGFKKEVVGRKQRAGRCTNGPPSFSHYHGRQDSPRVHVDAGRIKAA